MSTDYMLMAANDSVEEDSPRSPSPRPSTPTQRRSSQTRASAVRKNSVTTACERCRRRKIRCSGLPGPCNSCAKFKVACLDPGKRKQRSSSFLEDRIRRLEALAATGAPIDPAAVHTLTSGTPDPLDSAPDGRKLPGHLHIDTSNLDAHAPFDDSAFFSTGSFNSEIWAYPSTPGAYSDVLPDVDKFWGSAPLQNDMSMNSEALPDFITTLHRRAHTFPAVPVLPQRSAHQEPHTLLSPAYSDLPSIQITSHDGSRSPSPSMHPLDSSAITLPFRESFPPMAEPSPRMINRTPPLLAQDMNLSDTNMDYYGDFLSPLDHPPIVSRRPSISNSVLKPGMDNVSEWNTRVSTPFNGIPTDSRLKRRHTTCSIPRTARSATNQLLSPEMSWMLSSPRTTNYLNKYFSEFHPQYPFLNRPDFLDPSTAPTKPHAGPFTHAIDESNPTKTYTRLLTAAIGALLHHQTRDISSRYVRHAMSISTDSNLESTMWSSISGIHAAMLLAIYCLLENTLTFSNEEEDTSHSEINLWLWNCRIAAGCIDLGLHQCRGDEMEGHSRGKRDGGGARIAEEDYEEDEVSQLTELYRNTFRSAFVLDRRISEVRHRPRAIHEGDVDARLIVDLV